MEPEAAPAGEPGRRVGWMELLFDLAFVAFVTEAAHGLHGAPDLASFLVFIAFSFPAWWAWTNVMATVNLRPELPPRPLAVALLFAMAAALVMAAAVAGGTAHLAAFALACAGLRVILLVLWVHRVRTLGFPLTHPLIYNGLTAIIWALSAFLPVPWTFIAWAIALVIEFLLVRTGERRITRAMRVDVAHGSERLGLFMIILLGESVLSIVTALAAEWTIAAAVSALLAFATIAVLAWGFFVLGDGVIERGLRRLDDSHDLGALLDTVLLLPYLFVVAVPLIAAGLYTAVADPTKALPIGAAVCLFGGLALFELGHGLIPLRYGTSPRVVLAWAAPGVLLPLVTLAITVPAGATGLASVVAAALVVGVVYTIAIADRAARRPRASQPSG